MRNLSRKAIPIFLMLMLVVLFSQDLIAQPGPPPPPPPPSVPIGGLLIAVFFAVGACFGVRKLKKYRKE